MGMSKSSGIRQLGRLPLWSQLQQRLEALPKPEVEESILLRVLVQALVIVGIIATDVAAEVAPGELPISVWAVPLSIVGATWSWYRRRDRNIPVKFLLAMGMLWAMAVFFQNILGSLNDTRLVLAQLLIQLQVLHSFDLPRRKDLGYSMVIGIILLGVAGTLSQTLAFAPLLLIFLAIALPVLVLDYRSRLGFSAPKSSAVKLKKDQLIPGLSWRRLGGFLLGIVALGLVVFALVPRVPGYQLRTFPVSLPSSLQNKNFEPNQRGGIVNPGYGKNKLGTGEDGNSGSGPGKMDDTYYYGFSSKMNQNLRGEMKPKEVLRVRSQAPGFWRVIAFDHYTGQGWEISRDNKVSKVNRPEWSYRFLLPGGIYSTRSREVIQSYTVLSELPNVIPSLAVPRELYFPTGQIEIDSEGGLRSPGILPEGLTYTTISDVAYRDRTLLGQASTEYPKSITKYYLDVPPQIADKIRQTTQEFLDQYQKETISRAKNPKKPTSVYEKSLYLAQYLKQHYTIPKDPLGLPFFGENEDLVDAFLFKNKGGYPDHFSTVLTVMLRSLGIPARLVVGFAPGQFNPFTGYYVIRNTDAYAMTEVYFPKYGWFAFDPIPGHDLIPPSFEEDQTFSVLKTIWNWVAGWLPSPVTAWLTRVFEIITTGIAGVVIWFWELLSSGLGGLFIGSILLIAIAFLGWLGWSWFQSWRYKRALAKLPPMESLYQQMLRLLAAKGFRKHPAQTPLEYVQLLREQQVAMDGDPVEEISQAYVRWRYGGQPQNLPYLQHRLRELIKARQVALLQFKIQNSKFKIKDN